MVSRWLALLAIVVGLAACLSTPDPAEVDAAVTPPDATPTPPDATPTPCVTGARPAPQDWPPAGIVVDSMQVADIDDDGRDDLVIAVSPPTFGGPEPSGVFVLYGPLPPVGPYQFHRFLDLAADAEIAPRGILLDDLDGDGCRDLAVAGGPVISGGTSYLAVFGHDHTASAWSGAPARSPLTLDPQGGEHLVRADLSAEAELDLAAADTGGHVDLFYGTTLASVPAAVAVPPPSCGWTYINDLSRAPRPGGGDRLVAIGLRRWNTIEVDGGGVPSVSEDCVDLTVGLTLGGVRFDLDGVAPDDIVVGGGGDIGAYLLDGTADPVAVPMSAMGCGALGDNFYTEGHALGDLGGTAEPEAVVIDYDDPNDASHLCLFNSVTGDADAIHRSSAVDLSIGPGDVRAVAIGDLTEDPDREVWVVDADGRLRCWHRGTGPVLESCDR